MEIVFQHCISEFWWVQKPLVSPSVLIKHGKYDEEGLEKEFKTCINNLNERKELCEQLVKTKPSLFSILKNVHK